MNSISVNAISVNAQTFSMSQALFNLQPSGKHIEFNYRMDECGQWLVSIQLIRINKNSAKEYERLHVFPSTARCE